MNPSPELMPVVILAGGLATRLRPLTERIPKAMIDVAGHPFLWHQLQLLARNGARRIVLAVGYLGELVQQEFGDGSKLGLTLDYCFDGPVLLGTAGAIRRALPMLPERFFVLYGDSYLPCDYRAVQRSFDAAGLAGLMTVYRNEDAYDRSNVEYDGRRILQYDKLQRTPQMRYIDYGLGAFERRVFEELPHNTKIDLATVYQDLLAKGQLASYEARDRFYEIGSAEGLRETAEFLKERG